MDDLRRTDCPLCGIYFAIPASRYRHLQELGGNFWCPNGHQLHFGDNRADRLERTVKSLSERLANSFDELDRQRLVTKRIRQTQEKNRRRINAGVCPHCRRSFRALARHIKTKHPTEPMPNEQKKTL